MADIFDVLELVTDEWQSTHAIHQKGIKKVFSKRKPYESYLARLYEKGFIEKKETQQKVGIKTEWKKKK